MIKHLFCLVLILGITACSGGTPESNEVKLEGFTSADGELLFGGQPSKDELVRLKDSGVKTILTTRGEGELDWDEKAAVEELGMTFVSIPMGKPVEEISDAQVAAFAEIMANAERPMLLHCGSGNRVSGLWAVWLVEQEGMTPDRALEMATETGMTGVRSVVEKRLAGSASP